MNNGPAVPNGDLKLAEPRDGESTEGEGTQSTLFRAWRQMRVTREKEYWACESEVLVVEGWVLALMERFANLQGGAKTLE